MAMAHLLRQSQLDFLLCLVALNFVRMPTLFYFCVIVFPKGFALFLSYNGNSAFVCLVIVESRNPFLVFFPVDFDCRRRCPQGFCFGFVAN